MLACARFRQIPCSEIADLSSRWNAIDGDAELILATPSDEAIFLGAFQRSTEVRSEHPLFRRGSGGAAVQLGPGSVWLRLALARVDALVSCTPDKLINRHVRPLLRALSRCGPPASHFGRDWISADHRPVAMVTLSHEARTGRAAFEAVIAVTSPFAVPGRASFREKPPATIGELEGKRDVELVADAIEEQYRELADEIVMTSVVRTAADEVLPEPIWTATREEALGVIGAGRDDEGRMRVGGELVASTDAVADLERRLETARLVDIGEAIEESFRTAVTFGLRDLGSIRDVIVEAWHR